MASSVLSSVSGLPVTPEPMEQDEPQRTINNGRSITPSKDDFETLFDANDEPEQFELWSSDATSPDEEDDNGPPKQQIKHTWADSIDKGKIVDLEYKGTSGIINLDTEKQYSALECFKLFVDDDLIKLMVTETNRFARANFIRYGYHRKFLSGWLDVDVREMTQFLGMIVFMAFKRFPETSLYWSTERLYYNSVACRVFTQTRFHRLLAFWNFGSDNTGSVHSKVNPVIDRLNGNFKKYKEPADVIYVGRSTVYLRNRYIFDGPTTQDLLKKGSKILKFMDQDVYTYKLSILTPGSSQRTQTTRNVLNLLNGYLDQGRLVIFHNLWVSLDLAEQLLKRGCHSIGMIRKNSRGTPKELETKQLQDGDLIGYQNNAGVSVMKWQLLGTSYYGISTCHTLDTVVIQKRTRNSMDATTPIEEQVPKYLRDIALSEKIFDAHEKFSINTSSLNEQVKWYQRIALDAIVNTATTNALVLYKKLNNEKIKMWDFRDRLFRELVDIKQLPTISSDEETEEPDLDD